MAEKNYAVLRTEKLNRSKLQEMKKRCEHVNRVDHAENVNHELSHLNKCVLGEDNSDWYQLFKERYKELEHYKNPNSRKLFKNAVIGIEAVAIFSHEMIGKIDLDRWVEENNKWMQGYFGKENVMHGVLHMDEATPHIHYFVTPVKDGKFNAYQILGGKAQFSERQTDYGKAMECLGLRRGLKTGSRIKSKSIGRLYDETQDGIGTPEIIPGETIEEYRERIEDEYRGMQMRINALKIENEKLEITREYATDLEKEKDKLQEDYNELRDKNMRLEHNFKYRHFGNYLVEDLIYAAENYPDKDVIDEYLAGIEPLSSWALKYNDSIDREGEFKDIDDIEKDTPTNPE